MTLDHAPAYALAALIPLHLLAGVCCALRWRAGAARAVASAALTGIVACALAALALPDATLRIVSVGSAAHPHALALGVHLDALSLGMAAFIAALGLIVQGYAWRYLAGDPRRGAFMAALALVVAAALAQALSPGVAQFALGWIAASVGLHRLLRHHRERAGALLAARSKLVTSRLGDLAMLVAIAALLLGPGSTDLADLRAAAATPDDPLLLLAACALAAAVVCKTALAPFQHWLIGTVEAPTPLSALMHAGVVNAGGYLVVRCSPVFAAATPALDALVLAGLASALLGPLAMWSQTDLKRSLAWSTVGQMGFMAVQCGLGAFAAAFLHLLGHGCYKAHAFLRSGTLAGAVERRPAPIAPGAALARLALGALLAAAVLALVYRALLGGPPHGGATLVAVQAIAMAQLVATPAPGAPALALRIAALALGSAAYAALTCGVEHALAGVVAAAPALGARGAVGAALAVAVVLGLAALAAFWALLPAWATHPRVVALRVHAGNGFYLAQLTDRLLRRLPWRRTAAARLPGAPS